MQSRIKILAVQVTIALMFVVLWEIIGRASSAAVFLVGTPLTALSELRQLITEGHFVLHFLTTGFEALSGLLIGTLLGSVAGLTLWYSDVTARIARPFVLALGTLPVFAFAPLMIVWFGIGVKMKVALAVFSTVFVAFTQSHRGATSVSSEYIDVLRGMNATRKQIVVRVIVPGSLDWVLSSMRLNVGFGLLGAFIGEFIAADRGLGFVILRAASLYNVPRVMAAAVGITFLAITLDRTAQAVENRRYTIIQLISVPTLLWRQN